MQLLKIMSAVLLAMSISACGGDDGDDGEKCGTPLVTKPAGAVAVSLAIDDTANKAYADEDLEWKGNMVYDPETWLVTTGGWEAPAWAPLYDDGPWTCGGHEAVGANAGDHKFGTVVFVMPPATDEELFEYGLIDRTYEEAYGNGWIWRGSNGSFTVTAGQTADIVATPMTIPAFGTIDFRLSIDKDALAAGTTWDTSTVVVKGSAWAWGQVELNDDGTKGDVAAGDGIFTFVLSQYAGASKQFNHTGLLKSGDKPEWNFVLGGIEYKGGDPRVALTEGVTAETKAGAAFAARTIGLNGVNTNITVP